MASDDKKKIDAEADEKQDRADAKQNKMIADAVGKAVSEAMPMATIAAAQVLGDILNPKKSADLKAKELFSPTDRCSKCNQFKQACREEHVLLVVAPANPRRFERFPGIIVGGVLYISPRPGAPIYVPKHNDILHRLQAWENEEENLREGHSLTHDSGTLSPVPQNNRTNQANPLGFRQMGQ